MEKIVKEKYTIAVIEDEEVMSKSLAGELEDAGFAVIKAFDGETGLALVLKEKPDLVLLDIIMPKMDGITMMKKLRESGEFGQRAAIILLTNLNADDHIMSGITKNEPSYYLVKSSYTLEDLVAKVRVCLQGNNPSSITHGNS
ncbi:MAG: response regulator [Candidatus Uhrbacteria bacterium]|nr:response regulator [Candidatus Uhrbacteria bacterium]